MWTSEICCSYYKFLTCIFYLPLYFVAYVSFFINEYDDDDTMLLAFPQKGPLPSFSFHADIAGLHLLQLGGPVTSRALLLLGPGSLITRCCSAATVLIANELL